MVEISCVSHERFDRKPCWLGVRILKELRSFIEELKIMCYNILLTTDVSETGRQFVAILRGPLL